MRRPSRSDEELLVARRILGDAERSVLDEVRALRSEATQLLDAARRDAVRLREQAATAPPSPRPSASISEAEAEGLLAGAEASVAALHRLQAQLQTQVGLLAQAPGGALEQAVTEREAALEDLRAALDARTAGLEQQEAALGEREAALTRARVDLDQELAARRAASEAEAAAVVARAAIDAAAATIAAQQTAAGLIAEADEARRRGLDDALAVLDAVRDRLTTTRDTDTPPTNLPE